MKLFHRIGLCLAAAAAMFLSFGIQANAQQQTLKGVVIDQDGEPIIGAAVFVVETNKGEVTDLDGNFTIKVEKDRLFEFLTSDSRHRIFLTAVRKIFALSFSRRQPLLTKLW